MAEITGKAISVSIALVVASVLLPMGLNQIANASLTNVDASVVTIFQVLLPILCVISIAMYFWKGE